MLDWGVLGWGVLGFVEVKGRKVVGVGGGRS